MSLYVISDTHLALGNKSKSMDIFSGWQNYAERLKENWENTVFPDDTVVLPGDISWAMDIKDTGKDFLFIDSLPGTKIIGKGNHDYWWGTVNKMNGFLAETGISTIKFLFNNAFLVGDISVCGTRGWFFDAQEAEDNAKIILREAGRLKTSIEEGIRLGGRPIVFTHYPVVMDGKICEPLFDVLKSYGIERCYFGHIHADKSKRLNDFEYDGVRFSLISADFLNFIPKKVSLL